MKANELMIGDLVLVKGVPTIVYDVQEDGINIEFAPYDALVYKGQIFEKDISPIPLTSEILERNGFEIVAQNAAEPCYWHLFDYETGNVVNAFRRIYRGLWIECSNATTESSANRQCEYVHELQHALKFCEIEKEIVL